MENTDPNVERQVWERVLQRKEEPKGNDLRAMLLTAMEMASVYRSLMGTFTGKQKERAKQLYEGELANIAGLKGIILLSGGGEDVLRLWNPDREPARKLLEKCYHRTRRCMVEYTFRSADSEFGAVFQKMAEREGKHCAVIAELLGG